MPETAHKNSQSHEDNTTPATQMKRKGGRRRRFSAEERRDRNRVAQAAFRRKRSQHIRGLEVRLMHLHCVNKQLQRSGAALRNWVLERLDGADVKVESPPGAPHKWQSQELCAALRTFEEPCPDYKFPLDASGESYDLHPQSSRSFSTSSCDFPPPQPTPDELLSKTRRASLKAVTISPQTFDSSQMRRSRSMDDGAIPMSHYVFPTPGQELQDGTEACTCGHCTYAQDDIYESHIVSTLLIILISGF
ncbi:hypothetical protein DFS34DRAFT_313926 [Phlyctochytrium arcticum]|nr:hypothetical protein DFS34DRAFT_446206 [Phlyctochytrium arcticum]KAI9091798.1 hypothetical protein DFS34DRAFT_313926 [Phlyctochytrium arcticum]